MSGAEREPPSGEQLARFLELIRAGQNRSEAARAIGQTGSRMRAMCREGSSAYDPEFAAAYADARAEGDEAVVERLDQLALARLADPATASDRALHNERIYRNQAYRDAHNRQRVEMSGTQQHTLSLQGGVSLAAVLDVLAAVGAAGHVGAGAAGGPVSAAGEVLPAFGDGERPAGGVPAVGPA